MIKDHLICGKKICHGEDRPRPKAALIEE